MIMKLQQSKCIGCGTCVQSCMLGVFSLDTDQAAIAPCMDKCPCGIDIRTLLYLVQQDKIEEALRVLKKKAPFPAITSKLCAHPCESACIGKVHGIKINAIEQFLGEADLTAEQEIPPLRHISEVVIACGGLSGLSLSYFVRSMGYPVTVHTPAGDIWGVTCAGVPASILAYYEGVLTGMGVRIVRNSPLCRETSAASITGHKGQAFCLGNDQINALGIHGDKETGCTERENLFFVEQDGSAEDLIACAQRTARSIHGLLSGCDPLLGTEQRNVAPCVPSACPEPFDRTPDGILPYDLAQREALRCSTCGSKAKILHPDDCMTCMVCEIQCPAGAITVHPFKEILPRVVLPRNQATCCSFCSW